MKLKLDKRQLNIFLLLLLGFAVLWHLQSYVGMYYDDYGNASLSYGFTVPGVEGANYTLSQLLEWARHCYLNWGGRILYATAFIIPLLKNGIAAFMTVQSVVMILICAAAYKIICHYTDEKYAVPGILLLYILYGLIGSGIHSRGTYWASASVLYVWPLLPLFVSFLIYIKTCEKIKRGIEVSYKKVLPSMAVLLFFAACSQEQVGISVLIYYVFYILFDHLKGWKKYKKLDLFVLAVSLISYLILFCSPGNFKRLNGNEGFASLSLFEKIAVNMPKVLSMFFESGMARFNILLFIGMCIMSVYLLKENRKLSFFSVSTGFIGLIYAGLLMNIIRLPALLQNCFYFLFILNLLLLSLFYFSYTKRMAVNALVIAAGGSVFCLLYSPAVHARSYIEYLYIVFILLVILFIDAYERYSFYSLFQAAALVFMVVLGIKSITNFQQSLNGYRENYFALEFNHQKLKSYDKKQGRTIFLSKLANDEYRVELPYDPDFSYIEYWVKEYYNIPQEVVFQWGNLEVEKNIEVSGDFYEDGWFGKNASVKVNTEKTKQLKLGAYIIPTAPVAIQLICSVEGKEIVFTPEEGNNTFFLDLSNYEGRVLEVSISASETYNLKELEIGEDDRDLSMVLKIYQ